MSNEVSQAEFARLQGWSRSHITGLKQDGRMVMSENGKKVLVQESLARIAATKDPNRVDVAERHASERQSEQQQSHSNPATTAMDERVSATYQQSRAIKERYLALQAKAQYERDIGKLMDVDVARKAGADLGVHLRSSLENLQDQLSAELAPETDPQRIYTMLGEHFEITLNEISRKLTQSLDVKS